MTDGSNSLGFNALPGGYASNGYSSKIGSGVIFMSANSTHWRYIRSDTDGFNRRNGTNYDDFHVYAHCVTF